MAECCGSAKIVASGCNKKPRRTPVDQRLIMLS
ncbi:MAG: hypothetical protein ACI9W6_001494 [Motiliproteus sp.]